MRKGQAADIREFLLEAISRQPHDLVFLAANRFGVSRQAINRHLRALCTEGLVKAEGSTRSRKYSLASFGDSKFYNIDGLEEHLVWEDLVEPEVRNLPQNIFRICQHGTLEMVNNAIDHSEGSRAFVWIDINAVRVKISVGDDGIGIFRKIQDRFGLTSANQAMFELSKGKLTTDPSKHSGEGIFFTSRMFDWFSLSSGEVSYVHNANRLDWLLDTGSVEKGTRVTMEIRLDSLRTVQEVFNTYSSDQEIFDKTYLPIKLARVGADNLVSRSQARRVIARMDKFKHVFMDFEGIDFIGQAFADEIFRVFANENPDVELKYVNASQDVERMIKRAIRSNI